MKTVALAAAFLPLSRSSNTNTSSGDCLCIFDLDRTLTGAQGNPGGHCANNHVYPGIKDDAYSGGDLTLSEAGFNLQKTFCKGCFASVISHGHADGTESDMRQKLVIHLNAEKDRRLRVDDEWSMYDSGADRVHTPLVTSVDKGGKHKVALAVRAWFKQNKQVEIPFGSIHVFDDEKSNIDDFRNKEGFNARQISCASRDNTKNAVIGWCGATIAEIKPDKGIFECPSVPRRRRTAPPPAPPPPPPPSPSCSDTRPRGKQSCATHQKMGNCGKDWMRGHGLCCETCFHCKGFPCGPHWPHANTTDVVV